jgi:hypothetical protein
LRRANEIKVSKNIQCYESGSTQIRTFCSDPDPDSVSYPDLLA